MGLHDESFLNIRTKAYGARAGAAQVTPNRLIRPLGLRLYARSYIREVSARLSERCLQQRLYYLRALSSTPSLDSTCNIIRLKPWLLIVGGPILPAAQSENLRLQI
jgi:hypothetical protein